MSELLTGNLGGVVQPTSGNPNPISTLTKIKLCDFPLIPYFRPDPKFYTLFQTRPLPHSACLNIWELSISKDNQIAPLRDADADQRTLTP